MKLSLIKVQQLHNCPNHLLLSLKNMNDATDQTRYHAYVFKNYASHVYNRIVAYVDKEIPKELYITCDDVIAMFKDIQSPVLHLLQTMQHEEEVYKDFCYAVGRDHPSRIEPDHKHIDDLMQPDNLLELANDPAQVDCDGMCCDDCTATDCPLYSPTK